MSKFVKFALIILVAAVAISAVRLTAATRMQTSSVPASAAAPISPYELMRTTGSLPEGTVAEPF